MGGWGKHSAPAQRAGTPSFYLPIAWCGPGCSQGCSQGCSRPSSPGASSTVLVTLGCADRGLFLRQNDLQVCDVRHGLHPQAPALLPLRPAFAQPAGQRLQVPGLPAALCPEAHHAGAPQGNAVARLSLLVPLHCPLSPLMTAMLQTRGESLSPTLGRKEETAPHRLRAHRPSELWSCAHA